MPFQKQNAHRLTPVGVWLLNCRNRNLFLLRHLDLHPHHALRLDPLVELGAGEVAELDCGFLQRQALLVGVLGDGGGLGVADVRVERGHQQA
jgi:hypothetical protein